ncbi:pyridoxal phosphate-dependent decarboxylase family protein [Actinomadura litoris]|uniref:Aspartate aminotransferase family protein n=1 Tax=Actinomadura litoris TaxID=2678616 RepID=A0A7K1L3U1_9ACTN|nr:pyridoxal-dependent decarboxylase [Actinomadura litoris]MUN38973.1 aspartate aminotransferase family protein [Actinomadura litoris]
MHDDLARLPGLLSGHAARLLATLDGRPAAVPPGPRTPPRPLPPAAGLEGALAEFASRWEPGFAGSAGPRYFGFVTGGATPASVAGDWLTSVLDQNPATRFDSSAPDLEEEAIGWLAELLGLPSHTGAFVSGATMSNTTGLAIAREWLGERAGVQVADEGVAALGEITVLSAEPHSSVRKALSMLGIGRRNLRIVPALPGREAADVAALEEALAALGGRPAIVVASAGTVNTVDFDDLRAIAALRERHPFWLHVDAAFGAFAALSPAHADLVAGLDEADSVCVDLHKWLNVPYDSAVQFSRRRDLQHRVFHNNAAYLGGPSEDPLHLTPENSRRLRGLAAWCTLRAYGREGHRAIVERSIAQAHRLGELLTAAPGWRLLAPVRLNVVCFTHDTRAPDDIIRDALPEAFFTPTTLWGAPGLRAAFSNWRTTPDDVERAFRALSGYPAEAR